ncbi:ABC transporter substrate-binding protein [Subtercola boreus]|uniref:ABC transporter substrate-binding protein n=1 Tax=Subtercola boreus TaxID=120213 RepID=UPI001C0F092D|nr:sugar ABC transporter substrate-binding protein [Subtercola boreus]
MLQGTAGIFALGALAPLLSACSTGGPAGGGTAKEITFWNFYGPAPDNNPQSQWFVKLADDWNATNEVKIKLRYIAQNDYVNGNTLQTAFASGSGPDVFLLSPGDFLRYYNGGVLQELTPKLDPAVVSDFLPGTLDTRKVDDKVFALPMESEPLAMFYSKSAFAEVGLTDADVPKTWDDLLTVAKKLTTPSRFGVGFETTPGYYQNFTWYPFMWEGDGQPVSADAKSSTFNSKAVTDALTFWGDSISTGVAPKKLLGNGGPDLPANLGAGYVAMQQSGVWNIAAMKQMAPNVDYGIFEIPTPSGGTSATTLGGWSFCANAKGGNPSAAADFIAWALGSMSADSIERGRTWNTVAKTNIPVRSSVQDAANAKGAFSDPNMAFFLNVVAPNGRGEPRYPPEIIKPIEDAIQAVQLGGKDAASQAAAASDTINAYLSSYSGAPIV